jgi:hypothetical protein
MATFQNRTLLDWQRQGKYCLVKVKSVSEDKAMKMSLNLQANEVGRRE